jgi:hypothetical protein
MTRQTRRHSLHRQSPRRVTRCPALASVVALRDAVVAAGYPFPNWDLNAKDDGPKYAKESGTCTDDDVFLGAKQCQRPR